MTPEQLAKLVQSGQISEDQLNAMDHALLYSARRFMPRNAQDAQDTLAGSEHRAFTREAVAEDLTNAPALAAGVLAYQPYKMLMGARSRPSFGQVGQGLTGIGEGIGRGLEDRANRLGNRLAELLRR